MNTSNMNSKPLRMVIVGGVAAGASAAARARRLSEDAEIVLIERGEDVSFANCGLPYFIGGEIAERDRLALQTPSSLSRMLRLDVRIRTEAIAINQQTKRLKVRHVKTGEESEVAYDKLVLAPGASPLRPSMLGVDDERILTLRSLKDMDAIATRTEKVEKVLIIGAGFIGLEMAEQLVHREKKVTLVELVDQVLPQMDREMVVPVASELQAHGIDLLLGDGIEGFEPSVDHVTAKLKSGKRIEADMVILSIGVRAEGGLASAAGLTMGERGTIAVNEWMQTSDPDIYAAGDAVESYDRVLGGKMNLPLGGPANRQGRVIADHIFMPEKAKAYPGHLGTAIVRVFDMAAGVTGWTEKRLQRAGVSFKVATVTDHHHAGYYPGALPLTVKILWSPENGRLLGAQVFGAEGVDKRLDVLATALAGRLSIDDLSQLELAYAPPFGSARDVVNTAGFAAQNIENGLVDVVRELPLDRQCVDVRPKAMAELSPIPRAINIPLADLRSRVGELDSKQPIVTVCALGKSSYFASRILRQKGFDVVSLGGGMKMQSSPKSHVSAPSPKTPVSPSRVNEEKVKLDATGISCPGPLMRVKAAVAELKAGQILEVKASDPGFAKDLEAFCISGGYEFLGVEKEKGIVVGQLRKTEAELLPGMVNPARRKGATMVVFSNEMDKVMASLVIANGAAAMGGDVTLFFTFWGINALRREQPTEVAGKGFMDKMFGWMLPRGLGKLPLTHMNMGGLGRMMMTSRMASKNLPNLHGLLGAAKLAGIRLVACSMAMEAMGIRREELIDGVEIGGVADYLNAAEQTGVNLFI